MSSRALTECMSDEIYARRRCGFQRDRIARLPVAAVERVLVSPFKRRAQQTAGRQVGEHAQTHERRVAEVRVVEMDRRQTLPQCVDGADQVRLRLMRWRQRLEQRKIHAVRPLVWRRRMVDRHLGARDRLSNRLAPAREPDSSRRWCRR